MAQLAIKGHATRGNEVIEILEMLGGKNIHNYNGTFNECYVIDHNKICTIYTSVAKIDGFVIITLEEFLEKFPYKVGDKVIYKSEVFPIIGMKWNCCRNIVIYTMKNNCSIIDCYASTWMKSYKEEPMENKGTLVEIDLTREESKAEEIEVILGDYEFVLKDDKPYFVKKKPKYPKTYEECCKVLGKTNSFCFEGISLDEVERIRPFIKLLRCRNAYWKIAGEQMGLGKSWNQDYDNRCFIITNTKGNINTYEYHGNDNVILAFPTAEMRDAFKENFKDLIEQCKELL